MPHTTFSGRLALLRAASGSPPLSGYNQGTNTSTQRPQTLLSKNLDVNHAVLAQISNLVSQLSKRNFRLTSQELTSLSTSYGSVATLAMFKNLLSKIDLKSTRDQFKMQLLQQELNTLSTQTNFVSLICQAFEDMEPLPHDYLHKLSKALKLTSVQDLLLGVSLLHSHRPVSKAEGLKFLKSKLQELPNIVKAKLPEPLLHELVQALHNPNFDTKLRESSLKYLLQLYKSFAAEPLPHILTLLAHDESMLEARQTAADPTGAESNAVLKMLVSSLGPAQVMQDLGYACCQDESHLKVLLRQFGKQLDEPKVARILGMMANTHHGLEEGISLALYDNSQSLIDTGALASAPKPTTWNLDVFVAAVLSMAPKTNWTDVMHNLDYAEFSVSDLSGFQLLLGTYKRATSQAFPTHVLLSKWRNVPAQINMLKFALETLADTTASSLLAPLAGFTPYEGLEQLLAASPSPLCSAFACVPITNALLNISEECGYFTPTSQILQAGKSPLLLLAVIESKGSSLLKDEMATVLLAELLTASEQDAPYKWSLVRRIWSLNQLAVVDTMIHLYNKSSELLSSILAACQRLGALETILNLVPYTLFASDLSVLASNTPSAADSSKMLLNLNEWIRATITAHSDVFARSILQYIHTTRKFGASATSDMISVAAEKRSNAHGMLANSNAQSVSIISDATTASLLAAIKANEDILSVDAREELALLLPTELDVATSLHAAQAALLTLSDDTMALPISIADVTGGHASLAMSSNSTGEVEKLADVYFQQLYAETMTPAEFLDVLATLKTSPISTDRELFTCMTNNIFAEYNFFSRYPEKELLLTSKIFGGLIQNSLVDGETLNSAMSAILAAISIPPTDGATGMFNFGVSALSCVASSRLAPYPKYAAAILEVPHFTAHAPASLVATLRLVASLANATNVQPRNPIGSAQHVPPVLPRNPTALPATIPPVHQAPTGGSSKNTASPARGGRGGGDKGDKGDKGGSSSSGGGSSSSGGGSSSAGGAGGAPPPPGGGGPPDDGHNNRNSTTGAPQLNVATREMVQPDEDTTDRIHFILNNVSPSNMTQKSDDLAKCLKPQFFDYFASHLVSNRVSTDTRFQGLYLELIDRQNSADLFQKVLKTTYRAVHEILNSPKLTQSTERSWLKNLGTWLGSLTLARNRPVMHVDLAVKELVLKAYEHGTLHAVLPFVSKILQGSADSKVFRVPNPWFVAILRLLKEIHSHARAQQNIRFEIEILFQKIDEDLPSMPPSELLLHHTMYNGPSMKDFSVDNSASSSAAGSSGASSSSASLAAPGVAPHVPGTTNWMPTLVLSPDHLFMHQPALKQRLHHAFNKAIDDLVPEAEVTVSIVPKTTLRLVLKDFANEADETKVLMAARSMAQSLASSLLHATLRNHIRTATHNTMKASAELKQQYDTYQAQFHRAIDDNLEVACSVLAKHLVEKTLIAVEHELRPHLEQRSMYRDQVARNVTNRPFSDTSQISPQQQNLPDALKIRPGVGASTQQTALYDVFLRLSSLIQASIDAANLHSAAAAAAAQAQQVSQAAAIAASGPGSSGPAPGQSTAGMTAVDPSKVLGSHSLSSSSGVPMSAGPSGLQIKEAHQLDTKRALEKLELMIAEHERWADSIENGSLEGASDAQQALAALQRLPITILRETQDRVAVATTAALRVFDLMYTNPRANSTAASPQSLTQGSACASSAGNANAADENPLREMYARIMFSIARSTPVVVEALTQRYLQVNAGEAVITNAQGASVTLEPFHRELTYALLTWQLLRADMIDPVLASEISQAGTPGSQKAIDFGMWLIKCTVLGTHDASGSPSASGGNSLSASPAPGSAAASGASGTSSASSSVSLLAGSDLPRTLAELEAAMVRARSSDVVVVQTCAQLTLDNANMQSRRVATHTDHLQSSMVAGGPKRTAVGSQSTAGGAAGAASFTGATASASSSAQQRQQHLMLRQQSLAKLLPQPVVTIFSEWVSLWQHGTPAIEPMQQVLLALRSLRFVSFGEVSLVEPETHFLRGVIDAAVLAYLMQSQMQAIAQANLQPGVEPTAEQATYLAIQPYAAIDALTKLIVFLVKNYPENARHLLLQRVLIQTSASTLVDYASNVAEFNQRPYFRLLSSLLVHISDPIFGEKLESLFLSSFADVLVELRPQQCPGFAFAWLELLSHRLFLPKLIRHPRALFALHKLLIFHLTFLEPYLASAKLNEAVSALYQGTLRVFLVLIHDFPEFLCDFHHSFCDVLPPTCIQLRNLILSAFPRNIKLPDPALNIKMDQLPASKESPRVYNIDAELNNQGLRERVEEALKAGASITPNAMNAQHQIPGPGGAAILMGPLPTAVQGALDALFAALPAALFHKDPATGKQTTYNVKFINSLVLVVGVAAISAPQNRVPMDIYMHLANMLDAEGRYHLFNAFANQLRFPSSHTQYFSWALLHIFSEAQNDAIPEQITRVLLERYIAQKPTPWGLAITYQELTKNQAYNFWTRDFIKASPDIGRLFMNLSRRSTNQR